MSVQERRLLACPALGYIHQEKCSTKVHWLRIRWFLTVTDKAAQHQIQFQPPCLGASLRWSCDMIPANDIHAKNSFSKFKFWGFCFVVLFYLKIFNWQNNIHSGCTTQLFEICIYCVLEKLGRCLSIKGYKQKNSSHTFQKRFHLPTRMWNSTGESFNVFLSFLLPSWNTSVISWEAAAFQESWGMPATKGSRVLNSIFPRPMLVISGPCVGEK
jgi:hypothetical protein